MNGTSVESPGWSVLELSWQLEGHVPDPDVVYIGRRQKEAIEHALLLNCAGPLGETLGP